MSIGFDRDSGKKPAPRDRRSEPAVRPFAPVPVLSREDLAALAPYGRRVLKTLQTANNVQSAAAHKLNNLPNTALGLGYGLAGHVVGKMTGANSRIVRMPGGVEFINSPVTPLGALTVGGATIYKGDPYDRKDRTWWREDGSPRTRDGNPVHKHEAAHRRQGETLGLFYLPSNIVGGLLGLARDKDWHGPSNRNEAGPQAHPPRPWPERR